MNKFIDKILNFIVRMIVLIMLPCRDGRILPGKADRILIHAQMGIGNMIMFTVFVKALRNYFKDSQIKILFLKPNGAEQVLAGSGLVDEIVVWDTDKLSCLWRAKAVLKMIKWKPDVVISRFNSYNVYNMLITILSRVPYRVGHVSSGGWKGKFDYINNYPVKMNEDDHEIDRYLRLAGKMNIPVTDQNTVFHIDHKDEEAAGEFLKVHGINKSERFITIQMGTSLVQRWKQWDVKKWAELTEGILRRKIKVVALGSADEKEMIVNAFSEAELKPVIAAGQLTLKQATAVIKKSNLLVCNDSGLMHIAVAAGTPVAAIYGSNDYRRSAPRGAKHTIIRKDIPCSPCDNFDGAKKVEMCKNNRLCFELIGSKEVLDIVIDKFNSRVC